MLHAPKNQRVTYVTHSASTCAQYRFCLTSTPMDNRQINHTPWSDRLAFDVALMLEGSGEKLDEVVERHQIEAAEIEVYNTDPVFLRRVAQYRDEIRERGLTFKLKAKAQAEELLTTSWLLIHDADVSPAVKADLIKSTVKWAGYEPRNDIGVADSGGGVRITINLGGETSSKTIEGAVSGNSSANDAEPDEKPRRFVPQMPV